MSSAVNPAIGAGVVPAAGEPGGQVLYDVANPPERNRLTVAFRIILEIPHVILLAVLGFVAAVVTIVHWFAILFTGRRHEGLWSFGQGVHAYGTRVGAYMLLLHDQYPAFGIGDDPASPVQYRLEYAAEADRLTNGLRIIWAIPALIIANVLNSVAQIVALVSWFAILFTGHHPQGMHDLTKQAQRYVSRTYAYAMLLTDQYPRWE